MKFTIGPDFSHIITEKLIKEAISEAIVNNSKLLRSLYGKGLKMESKALGTLEIDEMTPNIKAAAELRDVDDEEEEDKGKNPHSGPAKKQH
jgi:hypothetical protein